MDVAIPSLLLSSQRDSLDEPQISPTNEEGGVRRERFAQRSRDVYDTATTTTMMTTTGGDDDEEKEEEGEEEEEEEVEDDDDDDGDNDNYDTRDAYPGVSDSVHQKTGAMSSFSSSNRPIDLLQWRARN
ncbi:uncharacterized protein LOC143905229 [Temnothorax americanus]|uniref:uncharacterized protein LOC143905229 n=1 Tax=Temnothorax americanus TaxID=1964332 RepID=UPI00406991AE